MNWYDKNILPYLINRALKNTRNNNDREHVVKDLTGTVLEIGFGSGLNLRFYNNIDKLFALEPSTKLYDLAKERIDSVNFPIEYLNASAEKIPLADKSIDAVVSTWTLCSIPNPVAALEEVARVLKDGGTFNFVEHGLSSKRTFAVIQKTIDPIWKNFAGGCHMGRDIKSIIEAAGFEIIELETFHKNTIPLGFMYRGKAKVRI